MAQRCWRFITTGVLLSTLLASTPPPWDTLSRLPWGAEAFTPLDPITIARSINASVGALSRLRDPGAHVNLSHVPAGLDGTLAAEQAASEAR